MKLIDQISNSEKVLWCGKKAKAVTVLESIFNPLLPFALLWGIIDFGILFVFSAASRSEDLPSKANLGILGFFAIHLLPVWMYLAGILTASMKAKHTDYCVTDKAVYVQTGVFNSNVIRKPYSEMVGVTVKQSLFDKWFKTGDVAIDCSSVVYPAERQVRVNGRPVKPTHQLSIDNISEYESVFHLVLQYQEAAAVSDEIQRSQPGYRGKFTAQAAPADSGMQNAALYQQQQAQLAQQQIAQSAFGQPVSRQPMFSDAQRGFSATSGSFVAGGIPQPQAPVLQNSFLNPEPVQPAAQPQSFMQPTPAPQPQSFAQPNQPAPAPRFTVPAEPQMNRASGFDMPRFDTPQGFEMPDLTVPDPPKQDFVDPTIAQAQSFRDPTLDYIDPNRPIGGI